MPSGSHASPTPGDEESSETPARAARWRDVLRSAGPVGAVRRRGPWAVATPLVVGLSGALFAVSAASSDGTDLRPGRYTDVASLVEAESRSYQQLQQRVTRLNADVARLTGAVDDPEVARLQQETDQLKGPAGLGTVRGPGLTVTLSDSPISLAQTTDVPLKLLLVHQQDVQAVVNAMWRGGASAVTIQGQRVVSTTAIKCEGNSITIQGVPYPQPYVISAVGDPDALTQSVITDGYLTNYIAQSEAPDIQIGWSTAVESDITAPPYDGLLDLSYATPAS